jgi:hypothetical protein
MHALARKNARIHVLHPCQTYAIRLLDVLQASGSVTGLMIRHPNAMGEPKQAWLFEMSQPHAFWKHAQVLASSVLASSFLFV